MYDYLIVGAGYSGVVLAERLTNELNKKVILVDKRKHIAGNAYDYYNDEGILIHKYGPHIFHTNSNKVWDYLSQFTDWYYYSHKVKAVIDGKPVTIPFNLNSIYEVFPEKYAAKLEELLLQNFGYNEKIPILKLKDVNNPDLQFLAKFIYENIFLNYTKKQWDFTPEELDPSVTARVPVYISRDDRYFQDTYQALPLNGYTKMFEKMLDHKNIHVLLNVDYKEAIQYVKFDKMIFTGPIDEFFDSQFGSLPYRNVHFDLKTHNQETHFGGVGTQNFPNDYDFTRITEYKTLTGQKHVKTTLATEFSTLYVPGLNEPYYPIPQEKNTELFKKYLAETEKLKSVIFCGRLADYKYYNMDQIVARALTVFEKQIVI